MMRTDEQVKKNIVDNLFWNNSVDASDIKIEVTAGEVTLSGTVSNYAAQISAISESWSVDGVVKINNEITVKHPDEIQPIMDDDIEGRATKILAWNPDLESCAIQLEVENGILRIKGSVDTFWKKTKAQALVSELKGVVIVENNLLVVPTQKTSDQSIAAYIQEVMNRNLNLDTETITISVTGGAVTLSGYVNHKHSYQDAYNAAKLTLGVTHVENNLKIVS
jgi:osmotically-inducible protein OsmY